MISILVTFTNSLMVIKIHSVFMPYLRALVVARDLIEGDLKVCKLGKR